MSQSAAGGEYESGARLKTARPTPPAPLPEGREEKVGVSFSPFPEGRGAGGVGSPKTTAPSAGRRRVRRSAPSAPSTNAAVDIASASAAVGASTLALAVPAAGQPVRGSSRWPSFRPLYSKHWKVAADVPRPASRRYTIPSAASGSVGCFRRTGQPRAAPGGPPIARALLPPACRSAERTPHFARSNSAARSSA